MNSRRLFGALTFNSLSRDHMIYENGNNITLDSDFQLPLSGSRELPRLLLQAHIYLLSTPSLGITRWVSRGGWRCLPPFTFNSLSRDHTISTYTLQ